MKRQRPSSSKVNAPYKKPRRTTTVVPVYRAPAVARYQPLRSGGEIKAIDIPGAGYTYRSPTFGTNIVLLNGVQTGTAFFNRIGSRVEWKNMHIRGFNANALTCVQGQLRMLIIYDRQPTGALPTVSDILQSRDQAGVATTSGASEINLDNRDRFTVIRDQHWYAPACTNTAGVLTNGPQYPNDDNDHDIDMFIKLKGLQTQYRSSSSPCTIADIASGAMYALFLLNGTDSAWTANLAFRLRYEDK